LAHAPVELRSRQAISEKKMPNGKPGDHPLTDIFLHGLESYGPDIDSMLREISALAPDQELVRWWERELAMESDRQVILERVQSRLEELRSEKG
jgi:hypothetical protein